MLIHLTNSIWYITFEANKIIKVHLISARVILSNVNPTLIQPAITTTQLMFVVSRATWKSRLILLYICSYIVNCIKSISDTGFAYISDEL